jgi:hypothetical protein
VLPALLLPSPHALLQFDGVMQQENVLRTINHVIGSIHKYERSSAPDGFRVAIGIAARNLKCGQSGAQVRGSRRVPRLSKSQGERARYPYGADPACRQGLGNKQRLTKVGVKRVELQEGMRR